MQSESIRLRTVTESTAIRTVVLHRLPQLPQKYQQTHKQKHTHARTHARMHSS